VVAFFNKGYCGKKIEEQPMSFLNRTTEIKTESLQEKLNDAISAKVSISVPMEHAIIRALEKDSDNLFQAELEYIGELEYDVEHDDDGTTIIGLNEKTRNTNYSGELPLWDIKLNPDVPLDLSFELNSGKMEADLREMQLTDIALEMNSGKLDIKLPQSTDTINGNKFVVNSGRVRCSIPPKTIFNSTPLKLNSGHVDIAVAEHSTLAMSKLIVNSGELSMSIGPNVDFAVPSIQVNSGKCRVEVGNGTALETNIAIHSGKIIFEIAEDSGVKVKMKNRMSGKVSVPGNFDRQKKNRAKSTWKSPGFDQAETQIIINVTLTSGKLIIR
jgi:hypothetical protein